MRKPKNLSLLLAFLLAGAIIFPLSSSSPSYAGESDFQPIGGYFIYAGTSADANGKKLDAIQATGADTVITFGSRLRPSTVDGNGTIYTEGNPDAAYADCQLDGISCVNAVKQYAAINRVFTYSDKSLWNGKAKKCANDRILTSNKKNYTLLVIPTVDNGCSSPNGSYDLIVIASTSEKNDANTALTAGAAARGMKYYPGMPAPVYDGGRPWLPDSSYNATLEKFTDRFMLEFVSKYNTPGLAGFYHHFEQNLNSAWPETLNLYSMQNRMIAKNFGNSKAAIVSPYIESRRNSGGASPASTAANMMQIVATSQGVPLIMAPQDGVGSAHGAAYYFNEGANGVDRYNLPETGNGTNDGLYIASFNAYYEAMRNALNGTGVTFWGNLEGFSASKDGANTCSNKNNRGSTTKDRLNKQIQLGSSYTAKNISFMWDDYYTCGLSNGTTLGAEMLNRRSEPIVVSAVVSGNNLSVTGFNLGNTVLIQGNGLSTTAEASSVNQSFGASQGLNPGLQNAIFPISKNNVNRQGSYSITISTSGGSSTLPVYLVSSPGGKDVSGSIPGQVLEGEEEASVQSPEQKAAEEKAKSDLESAKAMEFAKPKQQFKNKPILDILTDGSVYTPVAEQQEVKSEKNYLPLLLVIPLLAGAGFIFWRIRSKR